MKTFHLAVLVLILIPTTACQKGTPETAMPGTVGAPQFVQVGAWGGNDIGLDVTQADAKFEFDCAHGTINGLIQIDTFGRFAVDGLFFQESGGPVKMGQPVGVMARYKGEVIDTQMTLSVTRLDTGVKVGDFVLNFGATANIVKCL
jgi:hypothetical protein